MKENNEENENKNNLKSKRDIQEKSAHINVEKEKKPNNIKSAKTPDNRSFSEKVEDTLDNVIGGTYDAIYGPCDNYAEDIPAMIEKPSGTRVINKVQTRRNINKKLFSNKKFLKAILIIFSIPLGITILTFLISLFM